MPPKIGATVVPAELKPRGRQRHQQVTEIKHELDQQRLPVVEGEDRFQMGHQDVIEDGGKSPHEKNRRKYHECATVAPTRARRSVRARSCGCWHVPFRR
jgi:hypothetical protein